MEETTDGQARRNSANYYVVDKAGEMQEFDTKSALSNFLQDANIDELEAIIKGQAIPFRTKTVIVME